MAFSSLPDSPITKEVLDGESIIMECGNYPGINLFP